jgi:hypothetical protein
MRQRVVCQRFPIESIRQHRLERNLTAKHGVSDWHRGSNFGTCFDHLRDRLLVREGQAATPNQGIDTGSSSRRGKAGISENQTDGGQISIRCNWVDSGQRSEDTCGIVAQQPPVSRVCFFAWAAARVLQAYWQARRDCRKVRACRFYKGRVKKPHNCNAYVGQQSSARTASPRDDLFVKRPHQQKHDFRRLFVHTFCAPDATVAWSTIPV